MAREHTVIMEVTDTIIMEHIINHTVEVVVVHMPAGSLVATERKGHSSVVVAFVKMELLAVVDHTPTIDIKEGAIGIAPKVLTMEGTVAIDSLGIDSALVASTDHLLHKDSMPIDLVR